MTKENVLTKALTTFPVLRALVRNGGIITDLSLTGGLNLRGENRWGTVGRESFGRVGASDAGGGAGWIPKARIGSPPYTSEHEIKRIG